MYLRLSRDTDVQLVDTEAKLRSCSKLVESAFACAIDAEWQPNTQKPSATLVQLALKCSRDRTAVLLLVSSHPSNACSSIATSSVDNLREATVALQDLLELPVAASRPFLQGLFRNRTILKVGYGLFQDLKAVSTAIGSHGSGCISVVHPFIDLRILSKQLWRKYPTHAPLAVGSGLAGLVNEVFGMHLDKQLQCSSWGKRPLSTPQSGWQSLDVAKVHSRMSRELQYAALDAACLLGILQAIASLCLRREEVALGLTAAAAETGSREVENDGICSQEGGANGGVLGTAESRGVEEAAELLEKLTVSQRRAAEDLTKGDQHRLPGTAIAARDVWGCRLETSGGISQVIRLRDNRLLPAPHDDSDMHQTESSRLPPRIPWAQGEDSGLEPRFVADVPQEGLARQLRLCGFDAKVAPNLSKGERHLVYRFLVETAEREDRVILTCDRLFVRRRLSDQTFLVQGLDKKEQLADVLAAFNLKVVSSDLLSRCAKCNGSFIPRPMTYVELSQAGKRQVPPIVVKDHDAKFWVCADCQQVYWRGSQFERCLDHLSARLKVGTALTFA